MKSLLMSVAIVGVGLASSSVHGALVISEVYGGGSNTGAPFNTDYAEVFNNSLTDPLDVSGYVFQYRATGAATTFTTFATLPAGTVIPANSFFLVSTLTGNGVAPLPFSSYHEANTSFSAINGAVQVLNGATVVDLVGYGSSSIFEGTAAAPATTITTSTQRVNLFGDTNQNSADFATLAPTPAPEPVSAVAAVAGMALVGRRRRR